MLTVEFDPTTEIIVTSSNAARRKAITPARDSLNGYQKGKCFYCYRDISVLAGSDDLGDVDHFFPHKLKTLQVPFNLDGVWNLVLACGQCNRGPRGKFDALPALSLVGRLHHRNEYLIGSNHPLRETLIDQTGRSEAERRGFLQAAYDLARGHGLARWAQEALQGPPVF